ncbi:hypothetical protein BX600DRAFT_509003 [Xylariales sp. PMI_506]|nr:hypothetical protein BX600DRAFT_509003 [Xylariales sp. PMI_506]
MSRHTHLNKKRLLVCCDGTWQNSDNGFVKADSKNPIPTLQVPSNITRISRAFSRTCSDGTFQIIYYQSGVGSRTGIIDRLAGGAFGFGIAENIREAYAYICANYVDGDEIVLVGFSRGAFTARSIAGMISDLGLLTREGMEYFYPVFKDMQNWQDPKYKDDFPTLPFPNKPKGEDAASIYRERLVEKGYSRVRQDKGQGDLIRVKAIGVFDTVGSLGIPDIELLDKLGLARSTHEFQWYNTRLSPLIEHAFQALAIDETRRPFSPAVWERADDQVTDLRQVWFPGNHGNVGGGWPDQGISNLTLAWMMDQLQSVGVEFIPNIIDDIYAENVRYYKNIPPEEFKRRDGGCFNLRPRPRHWAFKKIQAGNQPVRPWSLHKTNSAATGIYKLAGSIHRSPGRYTKIDPVTGRATRVPLGGTNERIHSSVRVRLACAGLSLDDKTLWKCVPLLRHWRPQLVSDNFFDPVHSNGNTGKSGSAVANEQEVEAENNTSNDIDMRWVWKYTGPERHAPPVVTMVEDNLGPFEKRLLELSGGNDFNVFTYAAAKRTLSSFTRP